MTNKAPTICYACDQPATTKEHAPPSSFFPEGERNNLITVPSCAEHNNATSKDVEYARNIISVMFGVNEIGERHFADKTLRSFDRSPALLHTTFSDIRGVQFRGMQVGAFTVDTERIKTVVKACIRALHFRETGERQADWEIILPNMRFGGDTSEEEAMRWFQFLSLFGQIPFAVRPTNSPNVFEYAVSDMTGGWVYALRFYKSFLVYGMAGKKGGQGAPGSR
jgi:hypothetical protein